MTGDVGFRVHAGVDDVEIFAKSGVDGDHGAGGLLVALELTLFGIEHHDLLVALEDFDDHALRSVIFFGLGVGALQDESVGAEFQGVADVHGFLRFGVEGSAGEADEDEDHAEVNDVAAIAAGVAHGEFVSRHHHAHAGARSDDFCAAVELQDDGPGDEAAEEEAKHGSAIAITQNESRRRR